MLIGVLITFLVIFLYLANLLPLDGRAKQIVRDRHRDRHPVVVEIPAVSVTEHS